MNEIDIHEKLNEIATPQLPLIFGQENEHEEKIAEHRMWLQNIRREHPLTSKPYKVGVYIRYFNQTKYSNYLFYHKKQFEDTIASCVKWTLVDFYIDEGSTAPNMENSPEWCRLLQDCMDGKVDLIITQKISNVSKKPYEITILSRMLATYGIGIYFVSEDIFTMASYYLADLKDDFFIPEGMKVLDNELTERKLLND